jgi:2-dehydro-3-deoxyphosphogluconate aldolase/(4S)-4-hydroxy-2-oxoglutarate aldolase
MVRAIEALAEGGITCSEITLTTADALATIEAAAVPCLEKGIALGAGTVLDAKDCRESISAGAQFIVTPSVCLDVIEVAHGHEVPVLCGAFTATEVHAAWKGGADMIKIFPASLGGPEYIKALKGPFPDVLLAPTGGVGPSNMAAYFEAGAAVVGAGSGLVTPKHLSDMDLASVIEGARAYVEALPSDRPGSAAILG